MQQPQSSSSQYRNAYNQLSIFCDIVAFPVVVCTTRFGTWGHRYTNGPRRFGILWPLFLSMLFAGHPMVGLLLLFWAFCIVLLIIHAQKGRERRRNGYRCHSRFWGQSRFSCGGLMSERKARATASFAALCGGVLGLFVCPPLRVLFVIGALGKFFSDAEVFNAVDHRLRQMEDMRIENEFYFDLYRRQNGMD